MLKTQIYCDRGGPRDSQKGYGALAGKLTVHCVPIACSAQQITGVGQNIESKIPSQIEI